MLERCQLEPLRPDQCQRQQPGTGTGSRPRRPRYAPGCTRRSRSHRQCRQKARAAAHHAPPPWPFSFAPPSRLPGLPDQQPGTRWALCRPGEKLESTRGALGAVPGYYARHLHREGSAPPAPHRMTTPAADRSPDDHAPAPALPHLHSAHSLPALPDLTAAAPAASAAHREGQARQRRQPAACIAAACRMIRPAAPRKTAILRRRRRGQILHLTG